MPAPNHANRVVSSVDCAILTVSDTRTEETDTSGRLIRELLENDGHRIVHKMIVKDEPGDIRGLLNLWAGGEASRRF